MRYKQFSNMTMIDRYAWNHASTVRVGNWTTCFKMRLYWGHRPYIVHVVHRGRPYQMVAVTVLWWTLAVERG